MEAPRGEDFNTALELYAKGAVGDLPDLTHRQ
jgi:hypothetical protein